MPSSSAANPFGTFLATVFVFILLIAGATADAQTDTATSKKDTSTVKKDTATKFDSFNKKAEALFKIIPVPLFSYSTDAGNIFGLAKFNLINLSKKDTISKPSKLSEVVTFSSKGRISASVTSELVFHQNKYIILSYINYKKQPEYILGIGNSLSRDSIDQVEFDRIRFVSTGLVLIAKDLYAGVAVDFANYFSIKTDSNSFVKRNDLPGLNGGWSNGAGFSLAYDTRDSRYNPLHGSYVISTMLFYGNWMGGQYGFSKFQLDARKYFNPWKKHVIAMQATTTTTGGEVPFFELAKLGGDSKMRGYYEGALRDNVLVDAQVEYRLPVWNIFGVVGWIGTGRVAHSYNDLSLDGFHLSFGGGVRIRVDSKNNTNLRFDMGFGPGNISAFYINFAEAF